MVTIAIHQPNYLPWLGFFKKMMSCEIFVYLDDVQLGNKSISNRNKICDANGIIELVVPIISKPARKLNEVRIDNTKNWSKKHKKSISYSYSKSQYFSDFKDFFYQLYDEKFENLIDLNMKIIEYVTNQLDIKPKIVFSSSLDIKKKGSDRVLEICKSLNADHYISGITWAKDHLKIDDFKKLGITVEFQEFQHPTYYQSHGNFIPRLSIIDLLFNEGNKNSRTILEKSSIKSSYPQ